MLSEVERILLSRWEEFGFREERPKRFLYILSAERHWHSKTVFYCLPQNREKPALIVKIQRDDLHLPLLENESVRLGALHGLTGLQGLKDSIPRPLFFGRIADHPVLIETYLPGVPFSKYARRREPECFLGLSHWLRAFHRRTLCTTNLLSEEEIGVYFLGPLKSARRATDGHRSLRGFLDGFRETVEGLLDARLPFVCNHNDLCLNNVRFHDGRIGVIDWEFSRQPDLPLFDLLNAFFFFAVTWKRLGYPQAFQLAFSRSGEVSLLLRRCIRDYGRDLGLAPALLPLLVVQYLISRVLFLKSIGNTTNFRETVCCLNALAEGRVDLQRWTDLEPVG